MSQERLHIPEDVANHPVLKQAFVTLAALLHETGSEDLEGDFEFEGSQYHIEVQKVADLEAKA